MGKQYTFKTTKSTSWLEGVLDGMSGRDRSEFIRNAIISQLIGGNTSCTKGDIPNFQSAPKSDLVSEDVLRVQRTDTLRSFGLSDNETDLLSDIIEDDEDLDSTLDNIKFT